MMRPLFEEQFTAVYAQAALAPLMLRGRICLLPTVKPEMAQQHISKPGISAILGSTIKRVDTQCSLSRILSATFGTGKRLFTRIW